MYHILFVVQYQYVYALDLLISDPRLLRVLYSIY